MKTKNNVQKAILRSVALFVSLVLFSLTVTAQGYWKQLLVNNSFNHLASALVENPSNHDSEEVNAAELNYSEYLHNEVDEKMELEPWMISFDYELNFFSTEISEPGIQLEGWMMDMETLEMTELEEEPLKLESWMTKSII